MRGLLHPRKNRRLNHHRLLRRPVPHSSRPARPLPRVSSFSCSSSCSSSPLTSLLLVPVAGQPSHKQAARPPSESPTSTSPSQSSNLTILCAMSRKSSQRSFLSLHQSLHERGVRSRRHGIDELQGILINANNAYKRSSK